MSYTSIEICAGAGGQALGLERAGFHHLALVELDHSACETLRLNRPNWNVIEDDVRGFNAAGFRDVDLLAGGVPCPPFSDAGKQLGEMDERDLFPEALRLVGECLPRVVLLENVKGLLAKKFDGYRERILDELEQRGYKGEWKLINASDHGVSQLRPRAILVAMKKELFPFFKWPEKSAQPPLSVGELLLEELTSLGWDASEWKKMAANIAPTLVGGSKKHGGADLGPTRAKQAWTALGVDGRGIANSAPVPGYHGMPRLTLQMAALIQGFPKEWLFAGKKTPAYRQIGNAFPPPVAEAVGNSIYKALKNYDRQASSKKRIKSEAA